MSIFGRSFHCHDELELDKTHALWRAVINEAINDLLNPFQSYEAINNKKAVIDWVNKNEQDFNFICGLAGINPKFMKKVFSELIATVRSKKFKEYSKTKRKTNASFKKNWCQARKMHK
ncbi:hypothetical protein [Rickettsiales endosymbiont of Stachyamoeba lipophora]|uniref:hypothetical protein n=1 Tax=Rickettsiales endosymbiont of Stachyamoeba lipophora TaxID=2486578 RepID=UPI000F65025B|nr:hypothetical protein [Rickettsiales endosymbiont of Stachyamoeba lipophora]AZL16214.1 hypothetical protein EF513_06700 [Rickettsiales endosymbiont of Stachyamoeba lipophora]